MSELNGGMDVTDEEISAMMEDATTHECVRPQFLPAYWRHRGSEGWRMSSLHNTRSKNCPFFWQLEPTLLYREFCVLISRVGTAFVVATPTIQ
jgi:hypothetical protein